jgi:hypothetical protein
MYQVLVTCSNPNEHFPSTLGSEVHGLRFMDNGKLTTQRNVGFGRAAREAKGRPHLNDHIHKLKPFFKRPEVWAMRGPRKPDLTIRCSEFEKGHGTEKSLPEVKV